MSSTLISILKGLGRYLLGGVIIFSIFLLFFKEISHTKNITLLILFGTILLPLLFLWKFWKGGLISIAILAVAYVSLKSGISFSSNDFNVDCIDEYKAKRVIQDYYEERFFTQGVTWFSDQWVSEKARNGKVNVTAYYNADYCQPVCKEIFEVSCDGSYRLVDTDFSTNPNTGY